MGEDSKIEWTDHTFNAWWGCTKVSPACDRCYAEVWAKRTGHPDLWGVHAGRRIFGPKHWNEPLQWNAAAAKAGTRERVFCNSMADVFDNHSGVIDAREQLWGLIRNTPNLDWLILTKRIGNAKLMLPWCRKELFEPEPWPNVWLGISVCNQEEADRDVPKLLETPAAVRFLSVEPMLGSLDLFPFHRGACLICAGSGEVAASGPTTTFPQHDDGLEGCYACGRTGLCEDNEGLDWVICGGESGAGARPLEAIWAQQLRAECAAQGIAFFMKQGSDTPEWPTYKDFASFPPELQVRQWPR